MILGAGGACRSIAVEISSNNALSIEIRNRSIEKAKEISEIINENFNTKCNYSTKSVGKEDLKHIDILINTTPIGMGNDECSINEDIIPHKNLLVCDIVYKPHETRLLKCAKDNNLKIIHGIGMLINQGILSYRIWENIESNEEYFVEKNIYFNSIK